MKPLYKIFLVEDEIVTRESIRDRVDWQAAGFEFSGEAPDGEMALPLIQAIRPDVLITDIKMPFMNGLELCKIVHESMPEIKTIILSGHDEFNYAQEAVRLGVTEYLLKPVSSQDLVTVLQKVGRQIEREAQERDRLQALQGQVLENLPAMQDNFLRQLVLGRVSMMEAIKESMQIKLKLIARSYLVVFVRIAFANEDPSTLNQRYAESEQVIAEVARRGADVLVFKMGLGETVLIFKGDSAEHLREDGYLLAEAIKEAVRTQTKASMALGISEPCKYIGEIPQAFIEAFEKVRTGAGVTQATPGAEAARPIELTRLDPGLTEAYLKFETPAAFDRYFSAYLQPVPAEIQATRLFREYILLDILRTAANFVNELGGDAGKVIPELTESEGFQAATANLPLTRQWVYNVLRRALDFRDARIGHQYGVLIARAQDFIDSHFPDPALSLKTVAASVNLSSSHFSALFSRETGGTFIEYLTQRRIERAMTLLSTTNLRAAEISEAVGYDNPQYFSTVFKKICGLTPIEYRQKTQRGSVGRAAGRG